MNDDYSTQAAELVAAFLALPVQQQGRLILRWFDTDTAVFMDAMRSVMPDEDARLAFLQRAAEQAAG